MNLKIPVQKIPFSKYGSNMALIEDVDEKMLRLINVRQTMFADDVAYSVSFCSAGIPIREYCLTAVPEAIYLETEAGNARICLMGGSGAGDRDRRTRMSAAAGRWLWNTV